jgi:hypothetical protein
MRVNNLFGGTFIGVLLVLVGLAALLRSFNIDVPFGRLIIGLLIIYVGAAILFGGGIIIPDGNTAIFSSTNIRVTDQINDEYTVIFGSGVIDLRDIKSDEVEKNIEINTIFGASEILLDSNKSVRMDVSSAFGRASMPDGNIITFGDYKYNNISEEDNNIVNIEVSTVFGSTNIRNIR